MHIILWAAVVSIATYSCWLMSPMASAPLKITNGMIEVIDGDTVRLTLEGERSEAVRLAGCIDAPELQQRGGVEARAALQMIFERQGLFDVQTIDKDKYNRKVGLIRVNGRSISEEMVALGYAWVYPNCRFSPTVDRQIQTAAERRRLGIWRWSDNIPPWEYRESKRNSVR